MRTIDTCARAAAALLVMASGAAASHDAPGGHQQKIIIINQRHGAEGEAKVESQGPGGVAIAECDGGRVEFADNSESKPAEGKREKTRVVICSRGEASAADRAKRLEEALGRINSNDALSAETRTKITTALREAIGRLNAKP